MQPLVSSSGMVDPGLPQQGQFITSESGPSWSVPPEAIGQNFQNVAEMSFAQMEKLSKRTKLAGAPAKPEDSLTVHSVGMLRPKQPLGAGQAPQTGGSMRVIRETFVPAWSVPPKVLLVEDDATCQMLASKFLKVMGCTFEIAQDGVEAVNKMNLEKYDLVLMDIVMPQMDGISATTQIRQFDNSTPVISMTSNTNQEDCISYLSNGMNDILPKPFSRDSVCHTYQLWEQIWLDRLTLFFFVLFVFLAPRDARPLLLTPQESRHSPDSDFHPPASGQCGRIRRGGRGWPSGQEAPPRRRHLAIPPSLSPPSPLPLPPCSCIVQVFSFLFVCPLRIS